MSADVEADGNPPGLAPVPASAPVHRQAVGAKNCKCLDPALCGGYRAGTDKSICAHTRTTKKQAEIFSVIEGEFYKQKKTLC